MLDYFIDCHPRENGDPCFCLDSRLRGNDRSKIPRGLAPRSMSFRSIMNIAIDKYISYTQGLYGVLSATILFIKETEGVDKSNISTGTSTKKFLESCLGQDIIDESTFNLLYQTTIIRSLTSDHIQDGLMTWGTVSFNTIGHRKDKIIETPTEFASMYTLIIWPMKSYDELRKDTQAQLERLLFTDVPLPSFFCPHFSHITQAYSNLLAGFSNRKK